MAVIFISYAHRDQDRAAIVADRLRETGWDVWIDVHELRPLEKFTEEIRDGIRGCSVFLALYSTAYDDSRYCALEFGYAAETCGKTLACVVLDRDCPWKDSTCSFLLGSLSVPGFGRDSETPEQLRALADDVMRSSAFLALKDYRERGSGEPMPAVRLDDRPQLRLRAPPEKIAISRRFR